ncbi:MAG TPA: hypothetical protein VFE53_23680 [Mucilaginibacter sp.]|nr:hypothetical protein [Mucilaginibacter sp.]
MKKYLILILIACILWGCKKAAAPTGVPGKWKVTSDIMEKWITAPPEIYVNVNIKESPWYQFNNDGSGSFMRDTTGAGGITNFTYTLSRDSTLSYYQPIIKITVPPQVVNGVNIDGFFQVLDISQVNAQVLSFNYETYTAGPNNTSQGWTEYLSMTRIN